MKSFQSILAILFLLINGAFAQKKVIENDINNNWPEIKTIGPADIGIISPLGKYYAYVFSEKDSKDTIAISGIDRKFLIKREVKGYDRDDRVQFSQKEVYVGFIFSNDSLEIYDLISNCIVLRLDNVNSFRFLESEGKVSLLLQTNGGENQVLYSLSNMEHRTWRGFSDFAISDDNKHLIIKSRNKIVDIEVKSFENKVIYNGGSINGFAINSQNLDVYLLDSNGADSKIVYYQNSVGQAKTILSGDENKIPQNYEVSPFDFHVTQHSDLIFKIEEKYDVLEPETVLSKYKLWYSTDQFINEDREKHTWVLVYKPEIDTLIFLYNERDVPWTDLSKIGNGGIISTCTKVNGLDYEWSDQQIDVKIYNIQSGKKRVVVRIPKTISTPLLELSPNNKFILWWDYSKRKYSYYEIGRNIIQDIKIDPDIELDDHLNNIPNRRMPFGIGGWGEGDSSVFIYSNFDIIKVDLTGRQNVKCITSNQGKLNCVKLRILSDGSQTLSSNMLILSAFNVNTKVNGFVWLDRSKRFILDDQHLGRYCYRDNNSYGAMGYEMLNYYPTKALLRDIYLVRRESATQSPNLYITKDFVNYRQLTFINPETCYIWYKSQLIQWKFENYPIQLGILYYPENLDTTKKYPIIYSCYEKSSDELYIYKRPSLSYGDLRIPWYTSHGFAVFVPDITTVTGNLKQGILSTLSASLDALSQLTWIDTGRVGIQGHSHGGYETYIASISPKFKAAQVSSGPSDLTSSFSFIFGNATRQNFIQYGQANVGGIPWRDKLTYINNSPMYNADSISAPIFIMHPKSDNVVPVLHGMNMFTALRRLKKQAWLLMYESEGHSLITPANRLDFTIKQQEYFTYFLKGGKKPLWLERRN